MLCYDGHGVTEIQKARSGPGQPALVWAAILTVYVLWGSTYFAIRLAVETMPPLLMAGVRFMLAGLILCAWRLPAALAAGERPTWQHWRRAASVGALLLRGGNGGVAFAEQWVPSGLTALLVSISPLWMALIDRVFFRRPIGAATMGGLVIGFVGVAVLVSQGGIGGAPAVGIAVVLLASISWAGGTIYSRGAKLPGDLLLGTGMQMCAGGALLAVAAAVSGEFAALHFSAISAASWFGFWYLVIFGGIIGFSAYLWLVRNAPTPLVSTYAYVNPVVAVLLGWAALHEPIDWHILVGGAIIVLGVGWIVSANHRS